MKGKYFTTADNNKFTSDILDAKTKEKNQPINLIATLATKAELKAE